MHTVCVGGIARGWAYARTPPTSPSEKNQRIHTESGLASTEPDWAVRRRWLNLTPNSNPNTNPDPGPDSPVRRRWMAFTPYSPNSDRAKRWLAWPVLHNTVSAV